MRSGKAITDRIRYVRGLAREVILAGACAGALLVPSAGMANDFIAVNLDQAKLVRLPEGASTIVVGNPAIADMSTQKNGVVVITGRRAGRTNFIALDRKGAIISESTVAVGLAEEGRVVVRRGLDATSYDCRNECLPTPTYGDEEKGFKASIGQAEARNNEARESVKASR